jgi:hypothetical protein
MFPKLVNLFDLFAGLCEGIVVFLTYYVKLYILFLDSVECPAQYIWVAFSTEATSSYSVRLIHLKWRFLLCYAFYVYIPCTRWLTIVNTLNFIELYLEIWTTALNKRYSWLYAFYDQGCETYSIPCYQINNCTFKWRCSMCNWRHQEH